MTTGPPAATPATASAWALVPLAVLFALAALVLAPRAGAQQGPPPSQGSNGLPLPPSTVAGGSTGANTGQAQPPTDSPEWQAAAQKATVLTATEADLIDALGGFGTDVPNELRSVLDQLDLSEAGDRAALITALDAVDAANEQQRAILVADPAPPSREAATVLFRLSPADRTAIADGTPISIPAQTYLLALDDLVSRNGRPPMDGVPTINSVTIVRTVVTLNGEATGAASTTSTPAAATAGSTVAASTPARDAATTLVVPASESFPIAAVAIFVAVACIAAVAGLAVARRGTGGGKSTDTMSQLLEVSRRLAAVTTVDEVCKAAVTEAVTLAAASAGAVIVRVDDQLEVGYQSPDDLLVVDHLDHGVVRRAFETGQAILQVSATEPAIRNLPVAMAMVPLVGGGRVEGVLLVLRASAEPFAEPERDVLTALAPIAAAALGSARHADSLAEASLVDSLTNVGNRRRLDTELPRVMARATGPTTLIMIDLDHFKAVNDTHGHQAGDAVLRGVAQVVRSAVRPDDRVYRYGGEEFCVVLPDTAPADARAVADRMLAAVRDTSFETDPGEELRITVSLGMAGAEGTDAAGLIERADAALYRAKQGGRNRVVTADDEP